MDYFIKYDGRFEIWHVKDMEDSPERGFIEVGEGIIPYDKYFEEGASVSGMKYFFVEQDKCKIDSLESARISYKNLKKIIH